MMTQQDEVTGTSVGGDCIISTSSFESSSSSNCSGHTTSVCPRKCRPKSPTTTTIHCNTNFSNSPNTTIKNKKSFQSSSPFQSLSPLSSSKFFNFNLMLSSLTSPSPSNSKKNGIHRKRHITSFICFISIFGCIVNIFVFSSTSAIQSLYLFDNNSINTNDKNNTDIAAANKGKKYASDSSSFVSSSSATTTEATAALGSTMTRFGDNYVRNNIDSNPVKSNDERTVLQKTENDEIANISAKLMNNIANNNNVIGLSKISTLVQTQKKEDENGSAPTITKSSSEKIASSNVILTTSKLNANNVNTMSTDALIPKTKASALLSSSDSKWIVSKIKSPSSVLSTNDSNSNSIRTKDTTTTSGNRTSKGTTSIKTGGNISKPSSSSTSITTTSTALEIVQYPPLSKVIKKSGNGETIVGDVSKVLDFAILGHAKCATSFLMEWLGDHEEVKIWDYEVCDIYDHKPEKLVQRIYNDFILPNAVPNNNSNTDVILAPKYKFGFKCPGHFSRPSLRYFHDNFPNTVLIVGIRHPVKWFESFYNFRVRHGGHGKNFTTLPDPMTLMSDDVCPDEALGVCTLYAKYHQSLAKFGKSNWKSVEERKLLNLDLRITSMRTIHNPIFLYDMAQFYDTNVQRKDTLKTDFQQFLGLSKSLVDKEQHISTRGKYKAMDICDDQYIPLRNQLVAIGKRASIWIRKYFITLEDVHVSSQDYLEQILRTYQYDPCTTNVTAMLL